MTRPTQRRALLLEGGDSPHLLAAVRALTVAGWRVGIGGRSRTSRATRSRHVHRTFPVPPLENGIDQLVAGINEVVDVAGYDLVFPGDDAELLSLSLARDALHVRFPYPAHPVILRAVDKLALMAAAAEVGICVPPTEEATEPALRRVRQPVVVKPALHWTPGTTQSERHLPSRLCADEVEARAAVAAIASGGGRALLQQPVPGELMALTVVAGPNSAVLAAVQQRTSMLSLRQRSARAETVSVDSDLQRKVGDLLAALGWTGLANLQFLRPPGGPPHLIDFNARFYGSMALTRAAGVNVPALWAGAALGDPSPSSPVVGRPGARFQALEEDLQRARSQRRGGLVRDVAGSLAYARGAVHPAWSVTDPVPGLVSASRIMRSAARAGLATARRPRRSR
jgi:predicted ATP-grasp superfamily ATP-dependent carboligase